MAFSLRILCRRARRFLWNERTSAGYLRSHASLVCPTFPRHPTRILFAREHHRDGGVLVFRVMGSCCDALLSGLSSCRVSRNISGQSRKPSFARRHLPQVRSLRLDVYWNTLADPIGSSVKRVPRSQLNTRASGYLSLVRM